MTTYIMIVSDVQVRSGQVRSGQVRYGGIRRSSASPRPPSDGTPSSSVWPSPSETPGPYPPDRTPPDATMKRVDAPPIIFIQSIHNLVTQSKTSYAAGVFWIIRPRQVRFAIVNRGFCRNQFPAQTVEPFTRFVEKRPQAEQRILLRMEESGIFLHLRIKKIKS